MSEKTKFFISSACLAIYVGLFGYLGRYSSPSGDDYWFFEAFTKVGFWEGQAAYWLNWSGRFMTMFVHQVAILLGAMDNYGWHVPVAILFTLASLFLLMHTLFPDIKIFAKLFFSLLVQALWLSIAVELQQSLYWLCGFYYYWVSGVILIELALVVKIYRGERSRMTLGILAALIFLAAGTSELAAAYQLPIYMGCVLACLLAGRKKAAGYLFAALCVAIMGFAMQLLSPGNALRVMEIGNIDPHLYAAPGSLKTTIFVALESGLTSSVRFFAKYPIIYAILLFIPFFDSHVKQPNFAFKIKFWHIFAFEILTFCGFQAIGGYSMGNFLYPRAMAFMHWAAFAQWILFFAFLYRGVTVAKMLRETKIYKFRFALLILFLLLNRNFFALAHDYRIVPEYKSQLEERMAYRAEQKALGNRDIILPTIKPLPILFMGEHFGDPKKFPSASYYLGFNSIREVYRPLIEAARESKASEISLLKKLAESGDSEAMFLLAMYLDPSEPDWTSEYLSKDLETAVRIYIAAAERGNETAKTALWMLYSGGLRTIYDAELIKWVILSNITPF